MPLFDKLRVEPPRAKKHGNAYYAAMIFAMVIEFALGTNAAFLMYQNFKVTVYSMLSNEVWASILTIILAFAFGAGVFAGGMWTFAGFIDNIEDAKAYREEYGTTYWPESLIWAGLFLVVGLDFTTLLFRVAFFNEKGATALFAFFCVLIVLPPVLGPLIHVLEHTPRDRGKVKARDYASRIDSQRIMTAVQNMDDDLRTRYLEDHDESAITEHYERVASERQSNYEFEQGRIAERQAKQQNRRKSKSPLV